MLTYNKYFKYARKPQKMMASYHKNPCKRVVLALFSEHLSASENHNTLIYSIFKSHADSDRCFSTFIFLLCANIRGEYCVYTLLRMSLYMLYIKNFRQPYRILQQRPNNEQLLRAKIIYAIFLQSPFCPIAAVEVAIAHGFGYVIELDLR